MGNNYSKYEKHIKYINNLKNLIPEQVLSGIYKYY